MFYSDQMVLVFFFVESGKHDLFICDKFMVDTDLFLYPLGKRIYPAGDTDDFTGHHVDRMPLADVCLFMDQNVIKLFPSMRIG